jgi:ankyrin repeat protein
VRKWKPALITAASHGCCSVVKFLVEKKIGLEERGCLDRALGAAVSKGHVAVASLLIDEGADLEYKDDDQIRPLHIAVDQGHKDMLKLLVEKGVDINARGPG